MSSRTGVTRTMLEAGRPHVAGAVVALLLALGGCSAGPETIEAQDDIVQPLPTTTQPATVSRKPLLPPVPPAPASQPAAPGESWATSAPPLQYDRLYSDDEQAKIQAELLKEAARARAN